jgi:hypothetical protein
VKKSVLGLALVCVTALLALAGVAQAATVRYVATTGDDTANDCTAEATPCLTIDHAVAEASAGDTVKVGAGTYEESVTVDKSLTLLGAQAGVDARTRDEGGLTDAAESIISVSNGGDLTLTGGSITVDGFKIVDSAESGSGIFIHGATDNVIRDDIFDAEKGYASNGEFAGTTFRHDRVENSRIGFESDLAPASNVTIDANKFVSNDWYDFNFIEGGSGDVVSDNEATGASEANFGVLFRTTGAKVTGNKVTERKSTALYLGGGNTGTVISGNTFTGIESSGVAAADEFGDGPNRSFEVVGNTLTDNWRGVRLLPHSTAGVIEVHSNRISGNTIAGALNEGEGDLDATANWWGCDAGPNQAGCDKATGPMDSSKWLVLTLSASPSQIYKSVGTTQLTASLTRDMAGEVVGSVPGSTPVAFASTMGTVGGAEPTLGAGRATAQLAAGSTLGTAGVTVALDGETVHSSVEVIEAPEGEKGEKGDDGAKGDKGDEGEKGDTGSQGPQGTTGPQGEPGATGATGAKGETGATGAKGERGEKGEAGSSGSSEGSVALKRKMSLKFIGGKAVVSGGDAAVKVRCLGSTAKRCVGTLTLKVGGKSAKASYSVAAGKTGTVKVQLAEGGATDRGASTTVSATASTLQTSGGAVTTKKTLHLS